MNTCFVPQSEMIPPKQNTLSNLLVTLDSAALTPNEPLLRATTYGLGTGPHRSLSDPHCTADASARLGNSISNGSLRFCPICRCHEQTMHKNVGYVTLTRTLTDGCNSSLAVCWSVTAGNGDVLLDWRSSSFYSRQQSMQQQHQIDARSEFSWY